MALPASAACAVTIYRPCGSRLPARSRPPKLSTQHLRSPSLLCAGASSASPSSRSSPSSPWRKGLRSKVKKRLRTVKRGVVKRELADPSSKLGVRNTAIHKKLEEALSGYLKPEVRARNAFRYDDADAVVPQHNWRQGLDFRSDRVEDAGYACVGSNRPKFPHGRDGPTARVDDAPAPEGAEGDDAPMPAPPVPDDPAVRRLRVGTEQLTTKGAAKRLKRRMKQKGVDHNVFRWT